MRFTVQTGNTLPVLLPLAAMRNENTLPLLRPNTALHQLAPHMDRYTYIYKLVSLTYTYNYIDYSQHVPVLYIPAYNTNALPPPPNVTHYYSSKHYYMYNYRHFVSEKTALNTYCAKIRVALPQIGNGSLLKQKLHHT